MGIAKRSGVLVVRGRHPRRLQSRPTWWMQSYHSSRHSASSRTSVAGRLSLGADGSMLVVRAAKRHSHPAAGLDRTCDYPRRAHPFSSSAPPLLAFSPSSHASSTSLTDTQPSPFPAPPTPAGQEGPQVPQGSPRHLAQGKGKDGVPHQRRR